MTTSNEALAQLSLEQLDALLHHELHKDKLDDGRIRQLLRLLEEKEGPQPAPMDEHTTAAWERFKAQCAEDERRVKQARGERRQSWVIRLTAAAAMTALLVLAVPPALGSGNVLKLMGRWSESVFEFFDPNSSGPGRNEYVFRTDHPGLQQVYDTVVGLGVEESVVPMWLPLELELTEFKVTPLRAKTRVHALFSDGEEYVSYTIDVYNDDTPQKYTKDETNTIEIELAGILHYIVSNNDMQVAAWVTDNTECSVTVGCHEDILYKILDSIYMTEAD